jgi:hypothetical protein
MKMLLWYGGQKNKINRETDRFGMDGQGIGKETQDGKKAVKNRCMETNPMDSFVVCIIALRNNHDFVRQQERSNDKGKWNSNSVWQ